MNRSPIKVLNRTRLGRPTSIPLARHYKPPVGEIFRDARESVSSAFLHRKTADGGPISFLSRIKEFVARNKPNISVDWTKVSDVLEKIKAPTFIILGVAFIAGVSYLAYRLYKNFSENKAKETIDKIMKDLEETSPDLLKVHGWRQSVRNEVAGAVLSGNENTMIDKIMKIKEKIIEHQNTINPQNTGNGIDLFG